MSGELRFVDIEMVDVRLINRTNSNLNPGVVQEIVAVGIDADKFEALPAYFDGYRWTITDGNHRLVAALILGVQYVPVAPITREEFNLIAFSRIKINLMVRVPENLRYHTWNSP